MFAVCSHFARMALCAYVLATTLSVAAAPAPKPAPGRDSEATQALLPPALSDAINTALNALSRARDLNADQRKQAEEALHDALADDQRASEDVVRLQGYRDAAQTVRNEVANSPAPNKDVAMAVADWQAKLPQDTDNDQLGDLLEQERNLLQRCAGCTA